MWVQSENSCKQSVFPPMQHIRKSPSASYVMRKSAWNAMTVIYKTNSWKNVEMNNSKFKAWVPNNLKQSSKTISLWKLDVNCQWQHLHRTKIEDGFFQDGTLSKFFVHLIAVKVIESVSSVHVCVWICGSYAVHHFNGTELCCAPLTCIVHHSAERGPNQLPLRWCTMSFCQSRCL